MTLWSAKMCLEILAHFLVFWVFLWENLEETVFLLTHHLDKNWENPLAVGDWEITSTYQFVKRLEKFVLRLFICWLCWNGRAVFQVFWIFLCSDDTLEHWCKGNFIMFPFLLSTQEIEFLILLNLLSHFCSKLFQSSVRYYNFYFVDIERELYIERNKSYLI